MLNLNAGQAYAVRATVVNTSTALGQPSAAQLTVFVSAVVGTRSILSGQQSYQFGPGETHDLNFPLTIPSDVSGPGIIAGVLSDPGGKVLGSASLDVNIAAAIPPVIITNIYGEPSVEPGSYAGTIQTASPYTFGRVGILLSEYLPPEQKWSVSLKFKINGALGGSGTRYPSAVEVADFAAPLAPYDPARGLFLPGYPPLFEYLPWEATYAWTEHRLPKPYTGELYRITWQVNPSLLQSYYFTDGGYEFEATITLFAAGKVVDAKTFTGWFLKRA